MNWVSYAWIEDSTGSDTGQSAGALIEEQKAFFTRFNQPYEWLVYEHDRPDLRPQLEAHGFTPGDAEPLLALDLQAAPPALLEPIQTTVRRITQPFGLSDPAITRAESLGDAVQVLEGVYGGSFSWVYQRLGPQLAILGYLSLYVAYVEDEPACVAWTYFYPRSHFAGLWGGSTLAEQRGKGLYTALLATRVQEALRRGVRWLYLDASDMSLPIVKKYGFRQFTTQYAYAGPE